jgi:phospholipase C
MCVKQLLGFAAAIFFVILQSGCAGGGDVGPGPSAFASPTIPPTTTPIKHIVIIIQENRSPDNLFHGLPGADIANTGKDSHGHTIVLHPIPLNAALFLEHTHGSFVKEYDSGKMDGFDLDEQSCPDPPCAYSYVPPSEVGPYFQMAEQYTFGDRMFQTNQGPSFPAHQYLIAGTSEPAVGSDLLASENPNGPNNEIIAGCDAPSGTTVAMIDPNGNESTRMFPCFEHSTLIDLLDANHVPWKYYAPGPSSIWTGPNSINHLRFGTAWNRVIMPETKVLDDITANRLAQISWVIPDAAASDHPGSNDGSGPSWVASIVNEIGQSAYWSDTAIFIVWDDWGGFYDHAPPPSIFNSYELGMRVPFIVVSPYAKPGYVSKVDHEFGSILHYIEEDYSLGSLGFTDARADDLSDCFNYLQTPNVFHPIAAHLGPKHFLRAGAVHGPPDTD